MAQRFNWPRVGSTGDTGTPISPAFDASWEKTSQAVRLPARIGRTEATNGTGTVDVTGTGTNPNDVLVYQLIAGPFAPQTINTNWRAIAPAREFADATNARAQLNVRAVNLAGTSVLATLISHNTGALASEFPNAAVVSRRFPLAYTSPGPVVSATLTQPFYLVAEFGTRIHSTDTTNAVRLNARDEGAGGDASETEGAAAGTTNPWFEFETPLSAYGSFTADAVIAAAPTATTRLRVASSNAAAYPTFEGDPYMIGPDWDEDELLTNTPKSLTLGTTSLLSDSMSGASFGGPGGSSFNIGIVSFVSDPLAAQTISGSLTGVVLAQSPVASLDARSQMFVGIISNDGQTLKRTLLSADNSALSNEWAITNTSRFMPKGGAKALTSGVVAAGDRLLIEVGFRSGDQPGEATLAFQTTGGDLDTGEADTAGITWFEFNSRLVWLGEATLTANAVLRRTQESSFTADAIIRQELSFTSDAIVKAINTNTHTTDAVLRSTLSATSTADAVLLATPSVVATADAVTLRVGTDVRFADAVIRQEAAATFLADALIILGLSAELTADAITLRAEEASLTADAVIAQAVSATFLADAVLNAVNSAQLSVDAVTSRTQAASVAADAVIKREIAASFTADAYFRSVVVGSFTADATLFPSLVLPVEGSFTSNALIRAEALASVIGDAILLASRSQDAVADSVVLAGRTGVLSGGSVFATQQSGSVAADAALITRTQDTIPADAVVLVSRQATLSADAVLRRASEATLTTDAWLRLIAIGGITADAGLLRVQANSATASSVIRRELETSFVTDAEIMLRTTAVVSADAWLVGQTTTAFTADAAIFRGDILGGVPADAVIDYASLPPIGVVTTIPQINAATTVRMIEAVTTIATIEAVTEVQATGATTTIEETGYKDA